MELMLQSGIKGLLNEVHEEISEFAEHSVM